jgi:hypothetical protein
VTLKLCPRLAVFIDAVEMPAATAHVLCEHVYVINYGFAPTAVSDNAVSHQKSLTLTLKNSSQQKTATLLARTWIRVSTAQAPSSSIPRSCVTRV